MIDFTKELPADSSMLTFSDVRALRDYVFEKKLSDLSWDQVAHRWMDPVERAWLLRYAREMQRTRNTKQ